jgi:hypothetical protein
VDAAETHETTYQGSGMRYQLSSFRRLWGTAGAAALTGSEDRGGSITSAASDAPGHWVIPLITDLAQASRMHLGSVARFDGRSKPIGERSRTAEVVMIPSAAVEADRHGSISSVPTAASIAGADRQVIGTDTRDHPRFRLPIPDDVAVRNAMRAAKAVHCDFPKGTERRSRRPKVLSAVPERIRGSTDQGTDWKIRVRSSGDPRGPERRRPEL